MKKLIAMVTVLATAGLLAACQDRQSDVDTLSTQTEQVQRTDSSAPAPKLSSDKYDRGFESQK